MDQGDLGKFSYKNQLEIASHWDKKISYISLEKEVAGKIKICWPFSLGPLDSERNPI